MGKRKSTGDSSKFVSSTKPFSALVSIQQILYGATKLTIEKGATKLFNDTKSDQS